MGLLTGSAFPQGSAIIKWTLSLPEKAEGFTIRSYPEGHHGLLRCAANRAAQRISIYASRFGFLRALHLNIRRAP
jgi:hypothetical protein